MQKIALGIATIVFLIASGWIGRGYYNDSVELALERLAAKHHEATASAISNIKVQNKTIYAKTIEKVKTEIMYKECVADPEMMTLTNKILGQ